MVNWVEPEAEESIWSRTILITWSSWFLIGGENLYFPAGHYMIVSIGMYVSESLLESNITSMYLFCTIML